MITTSETPNDTQQQPVMQHTLDVLTQPESFMLCLLRSLGSFCTCVRVCDNCYTMSPSRTTAAVYSTTANAESC
jgi:hypothetical protein